MIGGHAWQAWVSANVNEMIKGIGSEGLTAELGLSLRKAIFLSGDLEDKQPGASYEPLARRLCFCFAAAVLPHTA